jgi:succinoglycan biosynthesis transport protein ExoP
VATVNRHVTPPDGTIVPSLLDYLRVLGRRRVLFLLIVLLVPATAVAASLSQAPTYRASAEVLIGTPTAVGNGTGVQPYVDPQRVAETLAKLARVPDVVNRVLEEVPNADLDRKEFLESSTVSAALGSDILTFSVESSDPQLAIQLANEHAHAFTDYAQELETEGNVQTRSAQVVTEADEAPKVGPRTVRNGLLALCLGLVLALVVVFLVDALDTRVRSVDAIREALGLRLLGRLSTPPSRLRKGNGLVMLADPTSRDAEEFRALRWSLDLANAEHGARTIMVTSAVDGEGKSTTVANLAAALARAGRRVVLIDGDLGRPHLHLLFDLDERPGLTDIELGEARLEEALRPIGLTEEATEADHLGRRVDRTGSLEVLSGGSVLPDPDELGFENAVGRIIQLVRDRADIVLVDAPPLLSHAIALSAHVDAVVVVVRLKALRTSTLDEMTRILEAMPVTKLGFIVTGVGKSEGYGQQPRYAVSERRAEAAPRLPLAVSPSAADGDGDAPDRRRSETHAGERPNETAGETETDGHDDKPARAPARARSKSADRPFGGLSPREAGQRSAQSRRAKSAQQAEAAERAALDEAQDALKDA